MAKKSSVNSASNVSMSDEDSGGNDSHGSNSASGSLAYESCSCDSSHSGKRNSDPNIPKWLPNKKLLIKFLHKRKFGNHLLIEELHERILEDDTRMMVICESEDASKPTGLGGVGKTVTANWYAHHYEQDYDHILWIDCEGVNLRWSFNKLLTILLKADHCGPLGEVAKVIYKELKDRKCLWIYDNAENYKGEGGVFKILPRNQTNFHCLITSRARNWGKEDNCKISEFPLDIFSADESLDFLKEALGDCIKMTEYQLKELGRLTGNLPLALQMAVASLNNQKIGLKRYIKKSAKSEIIFDDNFNEYEKLIHINVKIALDSILKEENGKLANKILTIIGNIRADNIRSKLFLRTLKCNLVNLENAIDLLEKYSLITKPRKVAELVKHDRVHDKLFRKRKLKIVKMNLVSIHPLLQQVIRHIGRDAEHKTLKKILGCKGFLDYKIIPFTKFADRNLQNEFLELKSKMLKIDQLQTLIFEKRFEESVLLSKFVDEEYNKTTTKFNHANCLYKNGDVKECVKILEELYGVDTAEERSYQQSNIYMGIFDPREKIARDLIRGHLLFGHWKMNDKNKIREILVSRQPMKIIHSDESLDFLIRMVNSDLIDSNYSLLQDSKFSELKLNGGTKRICLNCCSLSLSSFDLLSPDELTLKDILLTRNEQTLIEVTVSEFIDLNSVKRLEIASYGDKTKMLIDLSEEVSLKYPATSTHHWLRSVEVLTWQVNKNVQKLQFVSTKFDALEKLKIKDSPNESSVDDFSRLPLSTQKLILSGNDVDIICTGKIDMPNLKCLELKQTNTTFSNYYHNWQSHLIHFCSVSLTHIYFDGIANLDVTLIPKSVTHIRISKFRSPFGEDVKTKITGGMRIIDKLILDGFSAEEVDDFLGHFQTDFIVVNSYCGFQQKDLHGLMKKEIKTIAVGINRCQEETCSEISAEQFRGSSDYHLLESGRGKTIEKEAFEILHKLYK